MASKKARAPAPLCSLQNAVLGDFWPHVKKGRSCWPWTGEKNWAGYGIVRMTVSGKGRKVLAHRVAYLLFRLTIPIGLTLDHLCRNRACVNPNHLQPVTNKENILRGEGITAVNARKTHCVHGHAFTKANTYVTVRGFRHCRACGSAWYRSKRIAELEAQTK
jgi:hypothetical protein